MVKNRNVCNSVVLASASAALCFIAVALVGNGNGVHASVEDVMVGNRKIKKALLQSTLTIKFLCNFENYTIYTPTIFQAGLSPSDLNNLLLNLEDYPMPDYAL